MHKNDFIFIFMKKTTLVAPPWGGSRKKYTMVAPSAALEENPSPVTKNPSPGRGYLPPPKTLLPRTNLKFPETDSPRL